MTATGLALADAAGAAGLTTNAAVMIAATSSGWVRRAVAPPRRDWHLSWALRNRNAL